MGNVSRKAPGMRGMSEQGLRSFSRGQRGVHKICAGMRMHLGSLAQLGMNSNDSGEELEGGQWGRSQFVSFSNCL